MIITFQLHEWEEPVSIRCPNTYIHETCLWIYSNETDCIGFPLSEVKYFKFKESNDG